MTNRDESATHAAAFRRVWTFGILMVVVGLAVFLLFVVGIDPHARPFTIPWPLLAVAFYVTEINVVHIHFRRETQAFSLNEVPLVLGLFFSDAPVLVVAAVVGAVGALVFSRRQSGVKLMVNSGHVLLGTSLAVALFHLFLANPSGLRPTAWLVAGIAAMVASLVNLAAIFTAISLSEGRAEFAKLPQVLLASAVGTLTTASLALVGVTLAWEVPQATLLLMVPATMIYVAFSAYTAEKEKHESLEFLYESSKILQEAPEVSDAIGALIQEAQRAFRSEIAEATIYPSKDTEPTMRAVVRIDDDEPVTSTVEMDELERSVQAAVSSGFSQLLQPSDLTVADDDFTSPVARYVASRGMRDAMLVPLRGETRTLGYLMLANRIGQVSPYREDELRLFETLANNASVSLENTRLERTLTELNDLKDQLRHRAEHDALTGLANRSLFAQTVADLVDTPDEEREVAVLYLDLDDFKSINDTFGHEAGDDLLREVAERLRRSLRPGDLAARLGGDEFAVILDRIESPEQPIMVAERILEAFRAPVKIADRDIVVRTSIGVALSGDVSASDLIRNADVAMYRAKHGSKGRYAIFEPGMHEDLADRLELRGQLLLGVESEQFLVHYQPLVDLTSGAVVGMEALVRWHHPERGMVPPNEFIALAEETGLVLPIGDLVLRQATRQLAEWQQRWSPDMVMSVNISARQLKHDALIRSVEEVLQETGIDPATLILEITERDVMDDTEKSLARLRALKELGVQLAIDDFGTGYSSLAYLRQFPVDIVKIAKEFVDTIGEPGDEGVLAHAIIDLSSALGMSTIAEGIELPDQARRLAGWRCDVGQGWLWARAEPADAIDEHLRSVTVHRRRGSGREVLPGRQTVRAGS